MSSLTVSSVMIKVVNILIVIFVVRSERGFVEFEISSNLTLSIKPNPPPPPPPPQKKNIIGLF